jgi:hypothetical protein
MDNFKTYMFIQAQEIEKHKWIESEKAGFDLGTSAVSNWIKLHAEKFRETWKLSHN